MDARFEVWPCCGSYVVLDGSKDISGHLSHEEAKKLAADLNKKEEP